MDYYVYIVANVKNSVLYTGMTNELKRRIWEHKQGFVRGFTKKYGCTKLVFFEVCPDLDAARFREMQIKKYGREKKINLIENMNPAWNELTAVIS